MSIADFERIAWLKGYMDGADYIDIEVGEGEATLREFVAGFLTYEPGWMRVLWKIRVWLLQLLGQGKSDVSKVKQYTPESVPIKPGEKAAFLEVVASDGEQYWVGVCEESHLGAALGVIAQPVEGSPSLKRFQLITVVRYANWAGPIYFNIIKPFHHLVAKAALKSILCDRAE